MPRSSCSLPCWRRWPSAFFRLRTEAHARRVEIAMDFQDFDALARSYNYNPAAFLIALAAGRTHLAGGHRGARRKRRRRRQGVRDDGRRADESGARLADPRPAARGAASHASASTHGAVYLLVSDPSAYHRYRTQLALHFMPKSVRVLRATRPWLIEVRTQIDYFNTIRRSAFRPTRSNWRAASGCS